MRSRKAALVASIVTLFATASCELIVAPDHTKIPGGTGTGGAVGSGGMTTSTTEQSSTTTTESSTSMSSTSTSASSTSNGSTSSTGGGCDATACASTDTDCVKHTCDVSGTCVAMNVTQGGTVAQQTAGDCMKNQCNGQGSVEMVVDTSDVPMGTDCTVGSCNQGTPVMMNKPANTACGLNNMLFCDGSGHCVGCTAPAQCGTPANQCAAATCSAGMCGTMNKSDGTTCNDANACTQTDTCQAGVCTGSNPVSCPAKDQCHTAGTCDTSTGMCSNPAKGDGTSCNDGNACTQTDTCQSGICTGSNAKVCTASDQCHAAGICDTSTGMCSNPAKGDGTTCNDGNACTQTDTCQAGTCTGANPKTCAALDQCHVAGTCDPFTGVCSNPNQVDGTACNDGNSCTLTAGCQAGTCTASTSVTCSTNTCGTSLSAFTGTQTANWDINGSAAYDSGANTVVLTDGASMGEAGTVFYKDPILADSFTVSFDFKLTTTNGRADGIAFAMQTNAPTAVGAGFGGFGVMNLSGYGVELDIFDSGPCDPGNGNHAAVDQLSPCSTNGGIPSPVNTSPDLFGLGVGDVGDGQWRTATIQLAGGTLSVMITNSSGTPIAVSNLQGVALPGFIPGTPYYIGFGGGQGSNNLYARQEIRNVQVTFGSLHCL